MITYYELNPILKLEYKILNRLNFTTQNIKDYNGNAVPIAFLTLSLAMLTGWYVNGLLMSAILIFQITLFKCVHDFIKIDIDQVKISLKKDEKEDIKPNYWTFVGFKTRIKFYLIFFSLFNLFFGFFNFQTHGEPNIPLLLVLTTLMSTVVIGLLMLILEYTIGGLHNHRKLNYTMIALMIIYSLYDYGKGVY
jgi:hypothetical protein